MGSQDRRGSRAALKRYITLAHAALAAVVASTSAALASPPTYQIYTLGLTDAEHTRNDGFQSGDIIALNPLGQAAGTSERFIGGSSAGQSIWFFSEGRTLRLGGTGSSYTSSNGLQISGLSALSDDGLVAGWSSRFSGALPTGQDAWLFQTGSTTRLGLFDADHTAADGSQFSVINATNSVGQAIGFSQRYVGASPAGASSGSAWIYQAGATAHLGLIDSAHTGGDGLQFSDARLLNSAGHVAGISSMFVGSADPYQSSWFYNGATTTRIGLLDSEHTGASGQQQSSIFALSSTDQVAGNSFRYNGDAYFGQTAWVSQNGITTPIGLGGAEFTRADGFRQNSVDSGNLAGQVVGQTLRYDGGTFLGSAAWIYNAGNTTRIGLLDAEHTGGGSEQTARALLLNPSGQVAGSSGRYSGASFLGSSAWVYDGTSTRQTGLNDALHTRLDGYQSSSATAFSDAGDAVGISARFAGSLSLGNSGWYYDGATHATVPLVFSLSSDGVANTIPSVITPTHSVFGSYEKFAGATSLGNFGFYWSAGNGFHELGSQVSGALSLAGWQQLGGVELAAGAGNTTVVAGNGIATGGRDLPYLLWQKVGGGAWINPAGGNWQGAANWSLANAPSLGDDALFLIMSPMTVTFAADGSAHGVNAGAGNVTLDLAGHHLSLAGSLTIGGPAAATLKVRNGTVAAANLTIYPGGQLDLVNDGLIVDYNGASPATGLRSMIASGRNGGSWNGGGIVSSTAASDPTKSIGIADNAALGLKTFGGLAVDPSSVLIKLTWTGDSNLDGIIDIQDLRALALHFDQTSTLWLEGDFNYDGIVNEIDLGLLAHNWQAGSGQSLNSALAALGLPEASVPEPGAIAALVGLALLMKRKARKRPAINTTH